MTCSAPALEAPRDSGTERRQNQVFVTKNTEYHLRSGTCIAVRDRRTGTWLEGHLAVGRSLSGGVKVLEFPDTVWDAMGTAAKETMDQYNGDELYDRMRASYEASMRASSGWITQSEGAYRTQRDRVMG